MRQHAGGLRVGILLRQWRLERGLSQLALATEAGISARHLGFIEIGRAQPSRAMVLRLAEALRVPRHERNLLLAAAGFAPAARGSEFGTSDPLARIRPVLTRILEQEPFPALVMDRYWNLVVANQSCRRVFALFMNFTTWRHPRNALSVCFDPAGLRPFIANWSMWAAAHVQQLHREVLSGPSPKETGALLRELLSFPGVPSDWRRLDVAAQIPPLLPLELRKGNLRAAFLSSFTSFNMPNDVMDLGLRIECMYPTDASTERLVRAHAPRGPSRQ